ncbi:MAG: polyprenyl synthetase family protein [Planctomycetota bacterium]
MRQRCAEVAAQLDKSAPLTKDEMERVSRAILEDLGLPEGYLGWTMVVLSSEFWRDQVATIPPSRRLFLLPHCLKHAEGCPADYDEFGLDCEKCGACSIADFRSMAEKMGYKVLVAEGSPIVLKIIVSGHVDAITGVACLNVLEKAIDKILLAGIPCMAVPLLSSDCRNTSVDEDWVSEMIQVQATAPAPATSTYLHLMRDSRQMFQAEHLDRLAPRTRAVPEVSTGTATDIKLDPLGFTEQAAYDFLAKGGKYSRPFITMAVHDALTGGSATGANGESHLASLPDAVKRAAMAIEVFHKASLVHDDIEDEDQHRYGELTLHKRYGIPTAINVGDYLIGMGYRLVSRESATLGPEVASDILNVLAEAHQKLAEGQGAELIWRDAADKRLAPIDALKIYALKTSPAFEAALHVGARLAGETTDYVQPIKQFARNVGVGFQILNDLKDWRGDADNKLAAAGDILGGRPTLLLALALESLDETAQTELLQLLHAEDPRPPAERIESVRQIYEREKVFEKANRLVDKHTAKAEAIADEIEPIELRRLLYYLVDTVLERDEEPVSVVPLEVA